MCYALVHTTGVLLDYNQIRVLWGSLGFINIRKLHIANMLF